jgi:hypothetical protein
VTREKRLVSILVCHGSKKVVSNVSNVLREIDFQIANNAIYRFEIVGEPGSVTANVAQHPAIHHRMM